MKQDSLIYFVLLLKKGFIMAVFLFTGISLYSISIKNILENVFHQIASYKSLLGNANLFHS
jgi:hypothetical protein